MRFLKQKIQEAKKRSKIIKYFSKKTFKKLLILNLLFFSFTSCLNLERFRHEKYSCNSSNFSEIIIRYAKKGKMAKINSNGNIREAEIKFISKEELIIQDDKSNIQINRKSGNITVTSKGIYRSMKCNVSVFKL